MEFILEDEFGDILGKARRGLGLTISQLSETTKISADDLSKMENYEIVPDLSQVDKIASVLELSAERLYEIAIENWSPNFVDPNDQNLRVVTITAEVGGYPVHAYLLICTATNSAAIIDTAGNPDVVIDRVKSENVDPVAILLTHAHGDHADGLTKIEDQFNCPVWIHADEPKPTSRSKLKLLKHNDTVRIGNLEVRTIDTPGHTPGGCAFHAESTVIVGDAIFAGSIGNPFISYESLLRSVRENLLTLPDQTKLFPGHGPATTVGEEKQHNPFF